LEGFPNFGGGGVVEPFEPPHLGTPLGFGGET